VGAQWLVFLPLAYLIGPVLGFGLLGIWLAQIGYRSLQAALCAALWRSRWWLGVTL
jgi:multidrug resistance protein, MATE family